MTEDLTLRVPAVSQAVRKNQQGSTRRQLDGIFIQEQVVEYAQRLARNVRERLDGACRIHEQGQFVASPGKIQLSAGTIQDAKQDRDKLVGLSQLDEVADWRAADISPGVPPCAASDMIRACERAMKMAEGTPLSDTSPTTRPTRLPSNLKMS